MMSARALRLRSRAVESTAAGLVLGALAAAVTAQGPRVSDKVLEYLLAVAGVLLVACRPGPALAGLLGWLPVSLVLLGLLYHYGVPATAVRALGAVKDAVTIGLLLAVLRRRLGGRKADVRDWLALAFLAVLLGYLLVPSVVPGLLGRAAFHVRVLAWRNDVLFVALLLGARYAGIPPRWCRRVAVTVVGTGAVLAAGALWEVAAPAAFNHFMVAVAAVPTYQREVLGATGVADNVLTYTGDTLRAGSFLDDPITLPFYLLVPFGLLAAAVARRRHGLLAGAGLLLVAAGIVVTVTRSAMLGALFAVLALSAVAARRRAGGRVGLALLVTAAVAVAVPAVAGTALAGRITQSLDRANSDTTGHLQHTLTGLRVAAARPLGQGLGTVAGTGQRFAVQGTVVAEDSYLQIADEVGLLPLVLFVALLAAVLARLYRRTADPGEFWVAGGMFAAGVGLAVGGLLLQVWLDYSTALSWWGLAGLALGESGRFQVSGP